MPSIPTTSTGEGNWPPSRKAEQSWRPPEANRKELDLPAPWSRTLGSAWVRGVSGSGPRQSSSNPSSWKAGPTGSGFPPWGGAEDPPRLGQVDFQGPLLDSEGTATVAPGDWDFDRPSIPEASPRGVRLVPPFCGFLEPPGCRDATKAGVWSCTFCWTLACL